MDPAQRVREFIEIMTEHDLAELEVEEPELRVRIRKNVPMQMPFMGVAPAQVQQPPGYYAALAPGNGTQEAAGESASRG